MLRTLLWAAAATTLLTAPATTAPRSDEDNAMYMRCAKVCADCQLKCDSCYEHCLTLVADGQKEHVKTAQYCTDCGEFCRSASVLTARKSSLSGYMCEGCAKACDDCATSCERVPTDAQMADCAKICRDCAKVCREMIQRVARDR